MHAFLIIFGAILILVVWGAGSYFYGRTTAAREAEVDVKHLQFELGKANAGWDNAYSAWEDGRAANKDLRARYDSLDDLHRRCIAAKPVFLDPEPSVELTTWKTQTETRTMPVLEMDLTATGAWWTVTPPLALPAGGAQ